MALKIKKTKGEPEDEFSEDEVAHMKQYGDYYSTGVLEYESHWRMVQNIGVYAEQANIPEWFIWNSAVDILTPEQASYLSRFHRNKATGICGGLMTEGEENYIEKMYAMAGVMLRNYIAARYITLQDLITEIKSGHPPREKMILIPNLAVDKDEGGDIASWERSSAYGWILNAHPAGQQIVAYADSLQEIGSQYGGVLKQHVENHWVEFE